MHTGTGHTEQDDERDHSGSHIGNSGVSIASGIKQLSAADRATLVATIRTYLVSKGIVLRTEAIRDEMKQIKKDIHKAMKTMRKNMHDTLKQKQREMKEQLEDSK